MPPASSSALATAIIRGTRPGGGFKAALQNWLGQTITLKDGGFWSAYFGGQSFTGKRPTVSQVLQLSTGSSCVRLISETAGSLPVSFYERKSDGSSDEAKQHSLYSVLHDQPNADMTAVAFWEVVLASMLLWGNAYVEVVRSAGVVIALNFLHPARVSPRRLKDGSREYRYRDDVLSTERVISYESMMHIPAFSLDGICGISPVVYGANVFGTAIETDRASAETFQDSMRSPGVMSVNASMNSQQREDLRAHVKRVSEEGGVMIVENGQRFDKLSWDPVSAELLKSREWNVEEICRWFRVDPVMVGHGAKDSNWGTGLEQKMQWFITFTLRPWVRRIEQSISKNLLTPIERLRYFAEFNLEALLRGDSAARAAFYATMTQNGVMTRDQARRKENWPPMGGNAAVLTVQSNLLPIDKLGADKVSDSTAARDALLAWLNVSPTAAATAKE